MYTCTSVGTSNDFELLRILNYWSLNYQGFTVSINLIFSLHVKIKEFDLNILNDQFCANARTKCMLSVDLQIKTIRARCLCVVRHETYTVIQC